MQIQYTVPFEVVQRQNKMLKEFEELRSIYNNNSESQIRFLNHENSIVSFNYHPDIHPYYYDAIENDIILVKDQFTGKLIRKDRTVLAVNGLFYNIESPLYIPQELDTPIKMDYKNLLKGTVTPEMIYAKYKDCLIRVGNTQYIPFTLDCIDCQVSQANLGQAIYDEVKHFFPLNKLKLEPLLKVKEENIFNRILINTKIFVSLTSKEDPDVIRYKGIILGSIYEEASFIYIPEQGSWTTKDRLDRQDINCIPFSSILIGYIGKATFNTKPISRKTRNNDGVIMEFNANVCSFKTPFMMLEEEKIMYDTLAKDKEVLPSENNPIFLGLELELIARQSEAQQPNFSKLLAKIAKSNFGDHMIMKHDGSLKDVNTDYNWGIEFVTVPATLSYHKKMMEENFFNKENMFHKSLMSNEKCGIHVHISKNVLSTLQWGKFMYFVNAKENIAFMNEISNRQPTKYCLRDVTPNRNKHGLIVGAKMISLGCINQDIKKGLIQKSLGHIHELRRKVFNPINGQTMELRCFKSSTDKNNIFRKLEFCDALTRFVRQHSTQEMNVYTFVNFILNSTNKKEYPYLVRWLASKNYIGHTYKKIQGTMKLAHTFSTNLVTPPIKEKIK